MQSDFEIIFRYSFSAHIIQVIPHLILMCSCRQPMAAQTAGSPYLQQLYAASASPYMAAAAGQVNPNMMQLMGGQVGMAGTTGNPLLDM